MAHRFGLARVHGDSMQPTLREGQLVLLRYAATAHTGDVVVVRLPPTDAGQVRPLAIKRLTHFEADGTAWIESDNQGAPGRIDSWTIGPVRSSSVLAVVVVATRLPSSLRRAPLPKRSRIRALTPRALFSRGGKPRSG